MATRAEQEHANAQKKGMSRKAKKRHAAKVAKTEKKGPAHARTRAGKKATVALEQGKKEGRPSRKSTRASANRSKAEATLEIREEIQKGTPTNLARKAGAKAKRVRGSSRS
jgi:hypothetical protein